MFASHLHTQKTVLEKNDYDGCECKYERSFENLTVLSVDGRCALCFGMTQHVASR